MVKIETEAPRSLITYKEAAALLGVPMGTLYSWVSQNRVPHVRLANRMVRFDRVALEAWLDRRRVDVQ